MRRAVLLVLLWGCKIDLDERAPPDAAPDPDQGRMCRTSTTVASCTDIATRSDFAAIQGFILETNCGGDKCHSPGGDGTLDLSRDMAHETLLGPTGQGVMSSFSPQHKLIEPGSPSQSYLLFLMRGLAADAATPPFVAPPDSPGFMPVNSGVLCCQKIDAIGRWIEAGALP